MCEMPYGARKFETMTNAKAAGPLSGCAGMEGADPLSPRLTVALLDSCLQSAGRSFEEGELAYLALTSQIENPVRDRVAYQLHRRFKGTHLDVGREWTGMYAEGKDGQPSPRKIDLAVVKRTRRHHVEPQGVVEFKAVYAYEAQTRGHLNRVEKQVTTDVFKSATAYGSVPNDVYAVVLLPSMTIKNERSLARHVMKGTDKIRIDGFRLQVGNVPDSVVKGVADRLAPLGPVRDGVLEGGMEYGVHVTVPYVILGPIPLTTFETLPSPY